MSRVAALPMYDLPELRPWTDRLWQAIRDALRLHGVAAPATLTRPEDLALHWRDPALLLSQSCGYPLLSLRKHVRVVATPCYRAAGCDGASYRSAIVVRRDEPALSLPALRGRVCAVNGWDSNSGMNLLRASVARIAGGGGFFGGVVVTGSHAASLAAVAGDEADLAAIDCVTLALLQRHRPALTERIRILDWTSSCPGLPLVSAAGSATREALLRALTTVAADPALGATREALLIERFALLPAHAYDVVQALEDQARALGYPSLR